MNKRPLARILAPDALRELSDHFGGEYVYVPKRQASLDPSEIRASRLAGRSAADLAAEHGVSESAIYKVLHRQR